MGMGNRPESGDLDLGAAIVTVTRNCLDTIHHPGDSWLHLNFLVINYCQHREIQGCHRSLTYYVRYKFKEQIVWLEVFGCRKLSTAAF